VLTPDDREFRVQVDQEDGRLRVEAGSRHSSGQTAVDGDTVWVTIAGEVFVFTVSRSGRRSGSAARDHDAFTPPMSATVVRVLVQPGSAVKAGDVLVALEARTREMPSRAPRDGIVKAVHCREGDLVQPAGPLLELE
jgi:3-methylcrotonyl-CoA carboxylase alpha subunit